MQVTKKNYDQEISSTSYWKQEWLVSNVLYLLDIAKFPNVILEVDTNSPYPYCFKFVRVTSKTKT